MFAARDSGDHKGGKQITALAGLAIGAILVAFRALPVAAQAPRLVSLYATVERDGGLVRGLGPQNFHLYEDGDSRPFRLEQPETPMVIALLVEYSQRSYPYFNDIQTAVESFVKQAPEGNWYALATFSHNLEVQVDFTKQVMQLSNAFAQLGEPMWNEVDTYDAVYEMLDKMERLPGRRVLIVIASGLDSFSSHTLDDVQKKIDAVNVVIYGVGAGSMLRGLYEPYLGAMQEMSLLQAQTFLQMLADKSGGEAWFPKLEGAFPDVIKGIFQDLENQYRLVYESRAAADHKLHKIKLEAFQIVNDKRQNFKVRVREGWRF